ncbi:MAG: hypothetical protein ABSC20_12610 [Candidatus Bathyarchaeia archaeon]|jgi:hypothetical protein
MSKPFLNYHAKENDAIKGERIVIEARRFSNPVAISGKTSRQGAARVKADKAEAWVERAYVAGPNFLK